jgi:putative transposase
VCPRRAASSGRRLARLQRTFARQKKGSKNRAKTKGKIARLHQRIRRQRLDALHKLSTRWAKSHALIVLEDLRIGSMTRSAAGTVDDPVRNVAAKSALNRAILDQGWGTVARMLEYKMAERSGYLLLVPAHHSSPTCAARGHVGATNRPDRDTFRCVRCGHMDHADVNAARVVLRRGLAAKAA